MKLAVDSSSFAKRYVQEIGSDELDRFLGSASELAFCVILVPEIVSGLNRRLRERALTIADYRAVEIEILKRLTEKGLFKLKIKGIRTFALSKV